MERIDEAMHRALALAERGWGRVSPNPMVGAVVLSPAGEVVGEGWHEGPGSAHAEVMALAAAAGAARGATVVVTLEPCDRWGRTPPCTRAIADAGVARVIVAATDPDLGEGAPGIAELRAAGIEVATAGAELEAAARRLNAAFETHVRTGRPFVIGEGRRLARRQDRGGRRLLEVDHVARGAPRRTAHPRVVGRDRGRIEDGARR